MEHRSAVIASWSQSRVAGSFPSALARAACVLAAGGGCPAPTPVSCDPFDEVFVWVDADGDGFGDGGQAIGYTCLPAPGEATNSVDCDDRAADQHPLATELCDLVDNNCDGRADEGLPQQPWYQDLDRDGYGSTTEAQQFCGSPGEDWVLVAGDCDDADAAVNPLALEVCNGGRDDDCDGAADDGDGSVDPASKATFYVDVDGDGYGGDALVLDLCAAPNDAVVSLPGDCDDAEARISPDADEVCSPRQRPVDEDCDGLVDDADPSVDPASQTLFHADTDGDAYGDPDVLALACVSTPGVAVDNADDCDDSDSGANIVQDWFADIDGDGVGAGVALVTQCLRPQGDATAPEAAGVDCEPSDPDISPLAFDPCQDGVDQDCSGSDACSTCKEWMTVLGGLATSGVYGIEPTAAGVFDVYCDMEVDGGGWTLVSSSQTAPPADAAGAWHTDLATLDPLASHPSVWSGLRSVVTGASDLRFACKQYVDVDTFDVDLSFYDVHWYREITTGTDAQSCFNEMEGAGADPPPARRDNVAGAFLAAGDPYAAGYLEGEDTCGDTSDFTVDFDDRGMDANMGDGTDWGEDDNVYKCGASAAGQQWFLFVREL